MLARRANIGLTLASVDIDAVVYETVHVPGVVNIVYDGLSRGLSAVQVGLQASKQLWFSADHPLRQYVAACDPDAPLIGYDDHIALSQTMMTLLASPLFV
jgi:hypothetical protein